MLFPKQREGAGKIQEVILFGRYRVLSELGRGSGSIVFLARHQKLGECRAIKRISKDAGSAWKIREAEILNRLKHPQIPCIYDIEEDEEAFYIIEEYAEGESLEACMLQSSFITPDFIYQTITEAAKILDYMHHLKPDPMIYQDLKSEHVIIGKNGVKLIDFGIASYIGEPENKVQNYGTPEYCAPEKLYKAEISVQTDIFSIGKLLEDMIYAGEKGSSHSFMHIAKKAQSPDLSERYASIEAFLDDFTKHMQSKNISKNKKHLLKKIVTAGSQTHIGTTHISVSLTEYLNRHAMSAVYREKDSNGALRKLITKGGFTKEGGLYRRGNFLGMPEYGEGVEVSVPDGAIEILDYGTDIKKAVSEEADLFLLMIGSREWETEYSVLSYEKVKYAENLMLIANYGCKKQARQYAINFGRTVYCFPLDQNPFLMTKEKERLFERLLEKYWNCRKHPRQRRNAFVRCIGKLCGRRTW